MKSIHVQERTLPEGWETAVLRCWNEGARFQTQYDKPGDPESRDVACLIHVTEPFAEPRIHKAFPGGLEDLEVYRAEVLYGVHDHWVAPEEGKWEYTYHERLRAYRVPGRDEPIDQIAEAVRLLREAPYTRRAQAVTWQAWKDVGIADPACLQRVWFRIEKDASGGPDRLNLAIHIRSNDAFKAAFMNMFAFTELQRQVARDLDVVPGEYVHMADSFHIYGSYFAEFEGFLKMIEARPDRYFTSAFARPMFEDGVRRVLAEADLPDEKRAVLRERLEELTRPGETP
ncbi:MAG TPA: thymidylate synthase [Phycisphaerae bacterium]|nr:thymidylate synthase [Phycisphaerae bacterium]